MLTSGCHCWASLRNERLISSSLALHAALPIFLGACAAGGGTGIEQPLARAGLQQGGDALGGTVLHAPVAFAETRQPGQGAGA